MKKQDENLLKIFASNINNQQDISKESIALVIFNFVPIILSLVIMILWMVYFRTSGSSLVGSVPHLITAGTSYYCQLAIFDNFLTVIHTNNNSTLHLNNQTNFIIEAKEWLTKARLSYATLVYGEQENHVLPFSGYFDYTNDPCLTNREGEGLHDMIACFRPTVLIVWSQITSLGVINRYLEDQIDNQFYLENSSDDVFLLHHIQHYHLWSDFYSKLINSILPDFKDNIERSKPFSIPVSILICVLAIILEFLFFFILSKCETYVKFGLLLLLQCPCTLR